MRAGQPRRYNPRTRLTLSPGTRLGPYEVAAQIGAGGMGHVYKATDTRLGRTVAVRVSRDEFSARFEREARAVAALNHPNICQLYDVGPDGRFVVIRSGSAGAPDASAPTVVVVQHWAELKRLAPAK